MYHIFRTSERDIAPNLNVLVLLNLILAVPIHVCKISAVTVMWGFPYSSMATRF
jgi:hypothetical protein